MRRVAVSADVDSNRANANEILSALAGDFFQQLQKKYPGLYISLQGEKKKMRESFSSLNTGFPMALIGIFIIIAHHVPLLCAALCHPVHRALWYHRC